MPTNTESIEFPNKLHYYREKILGWSKKELSDKSGISDKTIREVERNNNGSETTKTKILNSVNQGLIDLGKEEVSRSELYDTPPQDY